MRRNQEGTLKRSGRIKRKPSRNRIGKVSGKVRLDAKGMAELRANAYDRAEGMCQMKLRGCEVYAGWMSGELAHWPKSRGAGAGDTLAEVVWSCRKCHQFQHAGGKPCPPKPK